MLPLALLLQAQRAPEECRDRMERDKYIEPVLLLATQRSLYTPVQNGAVVAEEVMQVATEGWVLRDELRIPGEGEPGDSPEKDIVFPAGTPLRFDHWSREPRCLPLAPRPEEPRRSNRGRLACLADGDGDGRFEQVRMHGADYAMHVPRVRYYRTITPAVPVTLLPDPLGDAGSRRRILRRVTIGTVKGDAVRFLVSHHFEDRLERPEAGRWDIDAGGAQVYRPPQVLPVPLQWTGQMPSANSLSGELAHLAEGRTVEIGGLKLIADRASPDMPYTWTVRSTTFRFPRWIHFGCGGRSLRVGTE
jgi:hypothetical protein